MEQKGHLRDTALPRPGIPQAQVTSPRAWQPPTSPCPHFKCLLHCLDICPISTAGSPSLVTSMSDRRDNTLQALGLDNQGSTITEGSLASSSLALCLGFLICEMD